MPSLEDRVKRLEDALFGKDGHLVKKPTANKRK